MYLFDDGLRRRATRDKAIGIFTTANLTDLERMARTYEWAVWFWLPGSFGSGDAAGLLNDMMLVLTELSTTGASENDGTFNIFHAGRVPQAASTGFKYAFRDDSNQVRHATASMQASFKFGEAGLALMQAREDSDSADTRLNGRCYAIAQGLTTLDPTYLPRDIGAVLRRELGDPTETGAWTGPPDGDPNPPSGW